MILSKYLPLKSKLCIRRAWTIIRRARKLGIADSVTLDYLARQLNADGYLYAYPIRGNRIDARWFVAGCASSYLGRDGMVYATTEDAMNALPSFKAHVLRRFAHV